MLVLPSHHAMTYAKALLPRPRVVVIGNFDGVHRGHKALLQRAQELLSQAAERSGGTRGSLLVLTFVPHPARVLAPHLAPPLICSVERKRELLAAQGVDAVVEEPFDRRFSQLSPQEFVEQILLGGDGDGDSAGLEASVVVVGYDFTFGKGRAGNTQVLSELLARRGAAVSVVPPVTVVDPPSGQAGGQAGGQTGTQADGSGDGQGGSVLLCSSTLVRQALKAGQMERAALLLGHDPELEGEVVHGAGRGRSIGVPTANLRCTSESLPAVGVYAAWAELLEPQPTAENPGSPEPASGQGGPNAQLLSATAEGGPPLLMVARRRIRLCCPAAVNVGYNPTFTSSRGDSPVPHPDLPVSPVLPASSASPITIEAHLITRPDEPPLPSLYGQTLRLRFISRVRAEQKFPSVAALVDQIGKDVAVVKNRLGVLP